jgi:hypothetical protein
VASSRRSLIHSSAITALEATATEEKFRRMQPNPTTKSLFIAVGHDGFRTTSVDGLTWSEPLLGKEGETYRVICFGGGRCVTAGSYGGKNIFAATKDGQEWQPSTSDAGYSRYVLGLLYDRDRFLALGGDGGAVGNARMEFLTSTDGIEWTKHPQDTARNVLRRVVVGDGLYVGVGDRGRRARSKDGMIWEDDKTSKPVDTLIDVAFGHGVFVGVGLHGLRMTSEDGLQWTDKQVGEEGEHLNSILWIGDRFVAVGLGATYFSADGRQWERRPNQDPPLCAAFGNNVFVGCNWKGRLMHSTDAVQWKQAHKCERHVEVVGFGSLSS